MPTPADFDTVTEPLGGIEGGQMLLRTRWLTLDPYMRSSFMLQPDNVGKTVIGGTVSEVVESRASGWDVGDLVGRLLRLAGIQRRHSGGRAMEQSQHTDPEVGRFTRRTINGARDTRHDRPHRLRGTLERRQGQARRDGRRQRRQRRRRPSRGPTGDNPRAHAPSASPADRPSAVSASTNSASTPASTTKPETWPTTWVQPPPTGSTSTSRTSAATSWRP